MTIMLATRPADPDSVAAIRWRRERDLCHLALAKARWKRRLTGLDIRPATPGVMPAK
jgi:hypothetical protein